MIRVMSLKISIIITLLLLVILKNVEMKQIVDLTNPWIIHKKKYRLTFTSQEEDMKRKLIFEANQKYINEFNTKNHSFTLKMNHLGHMSIEELSRGLNQDNLKLGFKNMQYKKLSLNKNFKIIPNSVDWRAKGVVTEVKNQKQCGSCWSFSATGAVESAHAIKYGKLRSLSEQQLVDCDENMGDMGCEGGLPAAAFEYVREIGLMDETDYPYTAYKKVCAPTFRHHNSTKIKGYVVLENNEHVLTNAIYNVGPISVAIDANHMSFQFYSSGVYYDPSCKSGVDDLDHALLAVGYGVDPVSGKEYYIVKNSWSAEWGDNGYVKIARNANNHCGIASFTSYPVV